MKTVKAFNLLISSLPKGWVRKFSKLWHVWLILNIAKTDCEVLQTTYGNSAEEP
jgi:hypothetical protein